MVEHGELEGREGAKRISMRPGFSIDLHTASLGFQVLLGPSTGQGTSELPR